jgi:phosphoglycerate dehydrogenase-like enzyme
MPFAMPALFLPQLGNEEPTLTEFLGILAGRLELRLYDHAQPPDAQFADVDVVVDHGGHGTRPMIDAAAGVGVRLWQVLGTGLDHTEVEYILSRDLRLANTPGPFSAVALAEHAILLMLCLAKNLRSAQNGLREGVLYLPVNDELAGRTLGLVGFGASARELAARAVALGMRVRAMDEVVADAETVAALGVDSCGGPETLDDLLRTSDYVSIHVPLTARTRGLISRERIALMQPTAVLVNVARGGIVDEAALAEALAAGAIRGAGIDVYTTEPPGRDSPFLGLDNVVATPHVAGMTFETIRRRSEACIQNVFRVRQGLEPLYEVTAAA